MHFHTLLLEPPQTQLKCVKKLPSPTANIFVITAYALFLSSFSHFQSLLCLQQTHQCQLAQASPAHPGHQTALDLQLLQQFQHPTMKL